MNRHGSSGSDRTLVHIPIIHTLADMGALGASVQRVKEAALGQHVQARNVALVEKLWEQIERVAEQLPISPGKVRVYQDGLPVCGHEQEIVSELANAGNRNYKLLLRLQARGAILMGTESPELLIEEYQLATATLVHGNAGSGNVREQLLRDSLLQKRDRFIADCIDKTLCKGESGILFMGMLHTVTEFLNPDIAVIRPIGLLPDRRARETS